MSLLKIAQVPAPAVGVSSPVAEAVELMAEEGVGAVAVLDNACLRGIFTERDLMLRVVLKGLNPAKTKIGDVMTSPPETATTETTAEEALNFMLERHIRHLPIVGKQGELLGMLSIRNLLEHMVDYLQREVHSLDQYLSNDSPGG